MTSVYAIAWSSDKGESGLVSDIDTHGIGRVTAFTHRENAEVELREWRERSFPGFTYEMVELSPPTAASEESDR